MFKKICTIIFFVFFALCLNFNLVSAKEPINVFVDEEKMNFDANPIHQNGRVLVPMRMIFEKLGAEVEWNNEEKSVSATKKGIFIDMTIGDNVIYKNTIEIPMDVAPQIVSGKTYIPIRAVAECLNALVEWNDSEKAVVIKTKPNTVLCIPHNESLTTYYGEAIDGIANGYGYVVDDKNQEIISAGIYRDGGLSEGTALMQDYSLYKGEFLDGRPHGNGKLTCTNGDYYEGYWNDGSIQGYGTFYAKEINSEFFGFFQQGVMNGTFKVTDLYTGEYENVLFSDGQYIGIENKNPNIVIYDDLPSNDDDWYDENSLFSDDIEREVDTLDSEIKTSKQPFDTRLYNSSEAKQIYKKYGLDITWILDGTLIGFDNMRGARARTEFEKQQYEEYKKKYEYHEKYLPIANGEIKAKFGY